MTQSDLSSDVLVDIVEALETCGLDRDEFQLYDSVDVESLDKLLSSGTEVEVRLTVEGIRLKVTPEAGDVLSDDLRSASE